MSDVPSRPMVRWHGGKWKLAPWIVSQFPDHRCYVEPFGGGGSVLLHKPRSYVEVYNDLDGEIVNLFAVMRDHGEDLTRAIGLTPFARGEFDLSYEPSADPVERARRLLVRSFMGFGSNVSKPVRRRHANGERAKMRTGFRATSNRSGTTPAHDWQNYPDAMPALVARLRGVVIENRDALSVMTRFDGADTVHYVDPPYPQSTRDPYDDYAHEMTDADHHALLAFLPSLEGSVFLSGYANPLYDAALSGWKRLERATYADGARPRVEVLWIKCDRPIGPLFAANAMAVA